MRRFLEKDCRGLSGDLACDPSAPPFAVGATLFFRCRPVSILRWIRNEWNERIREAVAASVRLGCVIVSGLALGTDTCAHAAALEFGGETNVVLPGDIEAVVPRQNRVLAVAITASGSLPSEITPRTRMHKGRYIERNRITSALSDGVVVVCRTKHLMRGGTRFSSSTPWAKSPKIGHRASLPMSIESG